MKIKSKVKNFIIVAFIGFFPLIIGIIGLGLATINNNPESVIEFGLLMLGLIIFIIGIFSWTGWLFWLDELWHSTKTEE